MKNSVPVFRPTMEEFSDFERYMEKIESECAGFGMAKVIPPAEWTARSKGYSKISSKISHPIKQVVTGLTGIYQVYLISEPEMSFKSFKSYAQKRELPANLSVDSIERMFWKNIRFDPPIYGADSDTSSLFDDGAAWNLSCLPSVLEDGLKPNKLRGINTSFLYFGSWKSMFCWHKEDLDLYSINYLHFGKPKFWYCIPLEDSQKFERLCCSKFESQAAQCREFLRHKSTQLSPNVLKSAGIKFHSVAHYPGEFMVIFSGCYHMGFNMGFNCAEAVNFALEKWIPVGEKARRCLCDGETVNIDMDGFRNNLRENREDKTVKKQKV